MSDTQTRKTGDALILSGDLVANGLPDDLDWSGATGEVHIVGAEDGALERSEAVSITAPVGDVAPRYAYVGGPIDEGSYVYEVQVTFVELDDPLTFPNSREKFRLKVVPELA
jgi:hypothetical protein